MKRITTIMATIESIVASMGAHAFAKGVAVAFIVLAEKITLHAPLPDLLLAIWLASSKRVCGPLVSTMVLSRSLSLQMSLPMLYFQIVRHTCQWLHWKTHYYL